MERMPIGQFIRIHRKTKGMSQEELGAGICEQGQISRIESGEKLPSNQTLHGILQKLGIPDIYYTVPMTEYENRIESPRKEARALVIAFEKASGTDKLARREEALSVLQELEALVDKSDTVTQQRIAEDRIVLGTPEGPYPPARQRELLLNALRLTCPNFTPENVSSFWYTQAETELINQIAITYVEEGDRETAIFIYRKLLTYIQENNQQLSRYAGQMTMVTFNLARELGLEKRYREAAETAELGRSAAVQYGYYQFLPGLLHIMAECCHYLGEEENSKEFYIQAFYLYQAFEEWSDLEILKRDALEQLGLTFS